MAYLYVDVADSAYTSERTFIIANPDKANVTTGQLWPRGDVVP